MTYPTTESSFLLLNRRLDSPGRPCVSTRGLPPSISLRRSQNCDPYSQAAQIYASNVLHEPIDVMHKALTEGLRAFDSRCSFFPGRMRISERLIAEGGRIDQLFQR
ncbi:hypothetical protein M378DRAFT_163161 [Amanita muscaria Koide BX008]|uniref:Uncharacterized protein n=1 Tax=Amanita muscaria (strain Koide BX008) TaxID=946122 RepID=A0A0C2WRX0_AMAMK|nr:hypothetical protein M378DRAFT_163161 [Amanita muscaria Koide BX008]